MQYKRISKRNPDDVFHIRQIPININVCYRYKLNNFI